ENAKNSGSCAKLPFNARRVYQTKINHAAALRNSAAHPSGLPLILSFSPRSNWRGEREVVWTQYIPSPIHDARDWLVASPMVGSCIHVHFHKALTI
ncbi:MAG: hypothetical protein WA265_04355, partial [Rhodomicrobium sp.]